MKKLSLLFIFFYCKIGIGQNLLLNGNFENTLIGSCAFNLSNADFNTYMSDCNAFGSANEIDIQDSACGYTNPPNGNWFISLSTQTQGVFDVVALKLSSPLTQGNTYYLSFFDNCILNSNDSLLIGLSNDSSNFGIRVAALRPLHQTNWQHRTIAFTAPNNGNYLVLSNKGIQGGYNFIDNICLSTDTSCYAAVGVNDYTQPVVRIYPNPFTDWINFLLPENESAEVVLYDLTAKIILHKSSANYIFFNTTNLERGIYIYEVRYRNGIVGRGKIVKE